MHPGVLGTEGVDGLISVEDRQAAQHTPQSWTGSLLTERWLSPERDGKRVTQWGAGIAASGLPIPFLNCWSGHAVPDWIDAEGVGDAGTPQAFQDQPLVPA